MDKKVDREEPLYTNQQDTCGTPPPRACNDVNDLSLYAVENDQPGTYPASPVSLASRQDLHAWQGNLAPEDMGSQRVGRPDCGQDPMSEDAAIAGGGF